MSNTPTNPLLPAVINHLSYRSGQKTLINDVSFTLTTPAITAIMGSNGAGKSLLLRLLHGLLTPTAGSITWADETLCQSVQRRQSMVFQKPVLLRRSVAANIDFAIALHLKSQKAASADQIDIPLKTQREAILATAGLEHLSRQPARLLSGGEQQRLALARALVSSPAVLFLDEATASLDPVSTSRIEAVVKSVSTKGTKIIMVTHDIGQARRLADDVIFMHEGRVLEHTAGRAFFDQPNTEHARAYLEGRLLVD